MNVRVPSVVYCALFTSLFSNQLIAADITRGDIGSWLEQSTLADPPAAGTVIGQGELHSLHPWLAPGYREEFEFPHVEIEIQATGVVEGDLRAPRLNVQEGAALNGSIDMTAKTSASAEPKKPATPPQSAPNAGNTDAPDAPDGEARKTA